MNKPLKELNILLNTIKQYKFEIFLFVWLIAYVFFPFRPEPIAQIELSSKGIAPYLFTIWQFIPICLVIILLVTIAKNKELHLNIKWLQWTAVILLPACLIADYIAGQTPLVWGTVSSGGLMIAVAVLLTKRLKYLGTFKAFLISCIWAFSFVYFWEIMYQLILFCKSGFDIPYFATVIGNNLIIAVPVIFLFMFYKFKFNSIAAIIILDLFLLSVGLWAITGFNTLIYYDGTAWQPEAMNYASYTFSRLSKVSIGLLPLSLVLIPKTFKKEVKEQQKLFVDKPI